MVPMLDIFENEKVLYILLYFQDKLKFYLEITHQSEVSLLLFFQLNECNEKHMAYGSKSPNPCVTHSSHFINGHTKDHTKRTEVPMILFQNFLVIKSVSWCQIQFK